MAFLEYYPRQIGLMKRVPLSALPFRIGRSIGSQFVVSSSEVSKEHAEIFLAGDHFCIRDLGSTNGTYVNGYRIVEAPLADDDILHLANEEFRFLAMAQPAPGQEDAHTTPLANTTKESVARSTQHLDELLGQQAVRILFQPIVRMADRDTLGFEALGRGTHAGLSASPVDLLDLADRCGRVSDLSALFRSMAIADAGKLPGAPYLFLNLHPKELGHAAFLPHLADLTRRLPRDLKLVLELHENVVCECTAMRALRQELRDLNILVAYDDYGAGQARFLELAEMPPDFVKLDTTLIRHIDQVESRRNLIRALVRVSGELGVQVIAEGVETAEEAEVCRELGCEYAQGYYFGLPKMALTHRGKETSEVDVADLRSRLKASAAS